MSRIKYAKAPTVKITVRGLPWSIRFLNSQQIRKVYKEQQLLGLTDPGAQIIYVDYQQTRLTVLNTVFHELFHAWVATFQGSRESFKGAVNEEAGANAVGDGFVELMPKLSAIIALVEELTEADM